MGASLHHLRCLRILFAWWFVINHQTEVAGESSTFGGLRPSAKVAVTHPQISRCCRYQTKNKDPRTHTKQHQINFWGFGFRDNSCDFVDRYVPSKLCSNIDK